MEALLSGLRAVAEPTRLRILALCARAELSVTELVTILGQSQPRVSRHLKLMVEAGVLERNREGARAFYRPAERGGLADMVQALVELVPGADPEVLDDLERLDRIREDRAERASRYFQENAVHWEELRGLYVDDDLVDARLLATLKEEPGGDLLDIGTGTGRVLEMPPSTSAAPSASTMPGRCWRSPAPTWTRPATGTARSDWPTCTGCRSRPSGSTP